MDSSTAISSWSGTTKMIVGLFLAVAVVGVVTLNVMFH